MTEWFQASSEEVLRELRVDARHGLSKGDVLKRQKTYGKNETQHRRFVFSGIFNDSVQISATVILLLVSAVLLCFQLFGLNERWGIAHLSSGSMSAALIIAMVCGVMYLYADVLHASIHHLTKGIRRVLVRRGGVLSYIPQSDVVPGDIVSLDTQSQVPADIRLVTARQLIVDETAVTGAALPVEKNVFAISARVESSSQKNMVFAGSIITHGTAEGVVVRTGAHTLVAQATRKRLDAEMLPVVPQTANRFGLSLFGLGLLIFVLSILRQADAPWFVQALNGLLFASSAIVVMVPVSSSLLEATNYFSALQKLITRKIQLNDFLAFTRLASVNTLCLNDFSDEDFPVLHSFQSEKMMSLVVFVPTTERGLAHSKGDIDFGATYLSENEIRRLSDNELRKKVKGIEVFVVTKISEKLRVLKALRRNGARVAIVASHESDMNLHKVADCLFVTASSPVAMTERADIVYSGKLTDINSTYAAAQHAALKSRILSKSYAIYAMVLVSGITGLLIFSNSIIISPAHILLSGFAGSIITLFFASLERTENN